MKKSVALLALAPLASFAEGESTGQAMTAVQTAVDTWGQQIAGFIDVATPYIISILGLGVALTALWIGWKLFRRGTTKIG